MEENKSKNNPRLEEIVVVLSTLEEILSKFPLVGGIYSKALERKYQKLYSEYDNIKLY